MKWIAFNWIFIDLWRMEKKNILLINNYLQQISYMKNLLYDFYYIQFMQVIVRHRGMICCCHMKKSLYILICQSFDKITLIWRLIWIEVMISQKIRSSPIRMMFDNGSCYQYMCLLGINGQSELYSLTGPFSIYLYLLLFC